MKNMFKDYLGLLSLVLLVATALVDIKIPFSAYNLPLLSLAAGWWLWSLREEIVNLEIGRYKNLLILAEAGFLGGIAYLLLRYMIINVGVIDAPPMLLSLLRFQELPVFAAGACGLLLVVYRKPLTTDFEKTENWLTRKKSLLILALLMLLGLGVRAFRLGDSDIKGDEFQVVSAAAGYLYKGDFYRWDWINDRPGCLDTSSSNCMYTRAWPHTWLIAQTYKLVGISEWSSRIPSLIFGVILIAVSYLVGQYLSKSRFIGLMTALLTVFSPSYISLSRYTRMYILLLPLFGLLVYTMLRVLHENWFPEKLKKIRLFDRLAQWLPYHLAFAFIALVLLYFNYQIHVNSLVLLPALFIYVLVLALMYQDKRYILPALAGIAGVIGGIVYITTGMFKFSGMISWFGRNNTAYYDHIFSYPGSKEMFVVLVISAAVSTILYLRRYNKKLPIERLLLLPVLLGFGAFFFVRMADRYSAFVYTSHLTLFAMIAALIAAWIVSHHLRKPAQYALMGMLLAAAGAQLIFTSPARYHDQGEAKHSEAYQVVLNEYNNETDAILGQYLRGYYLQGLKDPHIISMRSNKTYSMEEFIADVQEKPRAWVAWESGKTYHLRPAIVQLINQNFRKLHGRGIDSTGVEVYLCEDTQACLADYLATASATMAEPAAE
jgi:hypothetical protein